MEFHFIVSGCFYVLYEGFFCSDATHFYNRPKVPNLKKNKTETTSNMKLKSPSLGESPNAVIDILILVSNLGFPLRLII